MSRLIALWMVLLGMTLGLGQQALAAEILGVRSSAGEQQTRLVFELDTVPRYVISEQTTPGQFVLDLSERISKPNSLKLPSDIGAVKAVELDSRLMSALLKVTLTQDAQVNVFVLEPSANHPKPRLVLDFVPKVSTAITTIPSAAAPVQDVTQAQAVQSETPLPAGKGRHIVVSIDAGHGGQDPGAIGSMGNYEKHVTLSIARSLANYLNSRPGITARLTRDSDVFIPLQRRRQIARQEHKADIFLSIHADAAHNRSANGASVFALSLKGAQGATSRFAQELADQENRSDLVGGFVAESGELTDVLAMMAVEGSLKHSLELGRFILQAMPMVVGRLHSNKVEQAGFAVLKEPGMVSLLIETGFISNPNEEAQLTDKRYQANLAKVIGDSIYHFCQRFPVPGTWFDRTL